MADRWRPDVSRHYRCSTGHWVCSTTSDDMAGGPCPALYDTPDGTDRCAGTLGEPMVYLHEVAGRCCTADCCTEREMAEAECADLRADVERLRGLVQALEEECAARTEDGERLAAALGDLLHAGWHGEVPSRVLLGNGESADEAHDALVARYAPGAPNPLPDPVEGADGALSGGSEAPGVQR